MSIEELRRHRDACEQRMTKEMHLYVRLTDEWTADQRDPLKRQAWEDQKKVAERARHVYEAANTEYLEAIRKAKGL